MIMNHDDTKTLHMYLADICLHIYIVLHFCVFWIVLAPGCLGSFDLVWLYIHRCFLIFFPLLLLIYLAFPVY